jgi:hypothetical protein
VGHPKIILQFEGFSGEIVQNIDHPRMENRISDESHSFNEPKGRSPNY